jgi:hypothetical protein
MLILVQGIGTSPVTIFAIPSVAKQLGKLIAPPVSVRSGAVCRARGRPGSLAWAINPIGVAAIEAIGTGRRTVASHSPPAMLAPR